MISVDKLPDEKMKWRWSPSVLIPTHAAKFDPQENVRLRAVDSCSPSVEVCTTDCTRASHGRPSGTGEGNGYHASEVRGSFLPEAVVQSEHPLIGMRVKQRALRGASVRVCPRFDRTATRDDIASTNAYAT